MMLLPIKIPLLNPNEPDALLASLPVPEGASVQAGQVVAVIETTKSTGEVHADQDGYLVGLRFNQGDTLQAGEVLAYIGNAADASDPSLPPWAAVNDKQPDEGLKGVRITDPARELALAEGLDLDALPTDILVTRQVVQDLLAEAEPLPVKASAPEKRGGRLVIYGAGGHGCSLAALAGQSGLYEIVGFLDDGVSVGTQVAGIPVLGGGDKLTELAESGVCLALNGVGGIGDLPARLGVYQKLAKAGLYCPTVIHSTAFLEDSADLSDGVQVYPLAYVGVRVRVDYGSIINTGAIVSHDCELAAYVNLSPGSTLAGGVVVGEAALIGMRATVNLYVKIGKRARIGNGATVKADVPDGGVVPAGAVWPLT